jgi:predicted nuclease of predicted toxin-antitoxin system
MRFLVDMNLSPRWVDFLNSAGHEAVHWADSGRPDASDREVILKAASEGRIVLTCDLDFGAMLAAEGANGPSVVQIRSDLPRPETVGPTLLGALRQFREELSSGALLSVDVSRARAHILPLTDGE